MQIAAHKDLETGRIFETPGALADFQEERRKAAEAAARIVAIKARLIELRTVVLGKIETPNQLCTLVCDTYQEVLDLLQELVVLKGVKRTKAEANTRIDVVKVEAAQFEWAPESEYQPESGINLKCALKVTLTTEPYGRLFCEEMPNLDFATVMSGTRTSGGGSHFDEQEGTAGTYSKHYTTKFPLKKLPLMFSRVVALAALGEAMENHGQAVQLAQLKALKQNPEAQAISAELEEAERVLDEARKARNAVQQRLDEKSQAVAAEVAEAMPFAEQSAIDAGVHDGFKNSRGLEWSHMSYYLP